MRQSLSLPIWWSEVTKQRAERVAWVAMLAFHFVTPMILAHWNHDLPNEEIYKSLAKNIATTGRYVADTPALFQRAGEPFTSFAPAWPACLAVGYVFAGPRGFWVILGLVWCLVLLLANGLARVLRLPDRARWVFLIWITTNPTFLYYHGHVMTEPLALALGEAILALGILWLERPTWKSVVLFGAVSALGHLERTMLLLPAAAVLIEGVRILPWRRFVAMAGVFAAVHVAVIAPWLVRMKSVGAGMTATELKLGHNLYQFSNPYVENPALPKPDESFNWPVDLEDKTPAQRNAELVRLSLDGIRAQPLHYLRNCARRLYYQLAPWPNFTAMSRVQAVLLTGSALLYMYGSWTLFFISIWRGARPPQGARVLLIAVGLWYVCHSLIAGSVRMRLPSDPWAPALALATWAMYSLGRPASRAAAVARSFAKNRERPLATPDVSR